MQGPVFSSFASRGIAWAKPPKKKFWRLKFHGSTHHTSMENFVFRPDSIVDPEHHNSNARFTLNLPGLQWAETCKLNGTMLGGVQRVSTKPYDNAVRPPNRPRTAALGRTTTGTYPHVQSLIGTCPVLATAGCRRRTMSR